MLNPNLQNRAISLADFQARWIDVRSHGGKNIVYNTVTGEIIRKSEFVRGHHQPVQLDDGTLKMASALMKPEYQGLRAVVDKLIFDPGKPIGIFEDQSGVIFFNRWRDFDLAQRPLITDPAKSCQKILEFFKLVLADGRQADFDFLIWSLAWNVLNPDSKPCIAIILQGDKGAGKSTYGQICLKLFAPYSVVIESAHLVFGKFNSLLDCKIFILLEEAFWAKGGKQEDRAKHLITSDEISIERKGIDAVTVPNFLRIASTTNHLHAAPASVDERRYAVFEVNKVAGWGDSDWKQLYAEINGKGIAAFFQYLRSFQMHAWHPSRNVPQNDAIGRQKVRSLGCSVEGFLLSCIQNENLPQIMPHGRVSPIEWGQSIVNLNGSQQDALLEAANTWRRGQSFGRYEQPWTWQKLTLGLKKLGASSKRVNSNTAIVWTLPDPQSARHNLAAQLGVSVIALDA